MLSFDAQNKKRRRRAALGAAALFLMGALFGAYILIEFPFELDLPNGLSAQEEPEPTEDSLSADTPRDAVVAEDAKVEWLARFSACAHEVALEAPGGAAGMTRQQLAAAYPDYAVEMFDVQFVRMAKSVEGYCPAHYTLTMGEDALVITKTDLATLLPKEVMRIIADTSALDENSLALLETGVTFDSLEDINAYLEGAE
ncbi:MAG TPA: hypothetical protein VN540_08795 [Clostridia bacterium]|nr:hypothetical protein [Clostridia bacterium]